MPKRKEKSNEYLRILGSGVGFNYCCFICLVEDVMFQKLLEKIKNKNINLVVEDTLGSLLGAIPYGFVYMDKPYLFTIYKKQDSWTSQYYQYHAGEYEEPKCFKKKGELKDILICTLIDLIDNMPNLFKEVQG
jgi:hypothetical protein